MQRWLVRLLFGRRCISLKGEAGVPLRFRPAEYPSLLRGISKYAPEIRRKFARLLSADEVILDVGANIGLTVQRFFSILNGRCCIWAFEPMPRNIELLEVNARALGSDRVCLVETAVGDRDGEAVFCDNLDHGGLSRSASTLPDKGHRHSRYWAKHARVKVRVITLDAFLRTHPDVHPTFVKIDVEGAGVAVLTGGKGMLKRYRPALDCEYHDSGEREGMSRILEEAGYGGVVLHDDGRLSWCAPRDSRGTFVHPADPRAARLNLGSPPGRRP